MTAAACSHGINYMLGGRVFLYFADSGMKCRGEELEECAHGLDKAANGPGPISGLLLRTNSPDGPDSKVFGAGLGLGLGQVDLNITVLGWLPYFKLLERLGQKNINFCLDLNLSLCRMAKCRWDWLLIWYGSASSQVGRSYMVLNKTYPLQTIHS